MIWAIIIGVLLVVGIVLLAVAIHNGDCFDDWMSFIAAIILTVAIMCMLAFSVIFAQSNAQNSVFNNTKRAELKNDVASLNATYECLKDGNSHSIIEISHYNDLVRQFQYKIEQGQICRSNPWTNWFTSRVWNEFSVDDVKLCTP